MARFSTVLLILISAGPSAGRAQCTDIDKVNFANRTLTVTEPTANQVFHFHDGVSLEFEGGERNKPDWRTAIQQDVLVKPEGFEPIRFLTLFRHHLTGSGSWTYLLGLACTGGHLHQVFQSSGPLMRVIKISPKQLQISMPTWKPSDPACCPSASKEILYNWDPQAHRYTSTQRERIPHSPSK